jgi:hypothetical protein
MLGKFALIYSIRLNTLGFWIAAMSAVSLGASG